MNHTSIINQTSITEIILLGIKGPHNLQMLLAVILLVLYIITVTGNLLIVVLFIQCHQLHTPMYFFLSHLSLTDTFLSTSVVPNLVCALYRNGKVMPINVCITQLLSTGTFMDAECFILTIMSYDRYLAICNPLLYAGIMNINLQVHLVIWSWLISFFFCLIIVMHLFYFKYCGSNVIDFIYCDFAPLLQISCQNTSPVEMITTVFSIPTILFPFLFIIFTYVSIFLSIFRISTSRGRQKAISTCSSHLIVVCTFYMILIGKYTVPARNKSINMNRVFSILYTVVTPLLNPIIYSLRNQEIKAAVCKLINVRV